MDVDDEEDLVPEITKAHFEEAMKFARRLVFTFIGQKKVGGHLLFEHCVSQPHKDCVGYNDHLISMQKLMHTTLQVCVRQ